MVDAREKLADVELQGIAKTAEECLELLRRGMSAFSFSACERVRMEMAIEDRLKDVHDGMVNHSIAVGCGRDEAVLGTVNEMSAESPRLVGAVAELRPQPEQFPLGEEFELLDNGAPTLAPASFSGRVEQIRPS